MEGGVRLAVFGEVLLAPEQRGESPVITFPAGLVGLPAMKRFLLVDEGRAPWWRLESLDEPRLAFTVVNPCDVQPHYKPELSPEVLAETGANSTADLTLLVLAVEGPAGPETVNLLAPLVINMRARRGTQLVLDPRHYPLRWPVRRAN